MMLSAKYYRPVTLMMVVILIVIALVWHGPIAQPAHYHHFAEQLKWLGIPHAQNVLTNLPFLVIGLWGIWQIKRLTIVGAVEYRAWYGFFLGLILTAIGSAYYHWDPTNARLIWDRIPITFAFSCLLTAILAERISTRLAIISFLPLVLYGVGSVWYWYWTEVHGHSDLRPYLLIQLAPVLLIPLILKLYPARYTHGWMLLLTVLWYILAKVAEGLDNTIYQWNGIIAGHAIKHLLAALACMQVAWMLKVRKGC